MVHVKHWEVESLGGVEKAGIRYSGEGRARRGQVGAVLKRGMEV